MRVCGQAAHHVDRHQRATVGRPRPRGRALIGKVEPLTSSFPSGHTASDLSFTLGASQEPPLLLAPLSVATLTSHWSLVRSRKHYPSDVIAGGALAVVVTAAAFKLHPPSAHARQPQPMPAASRRAAPGRFGAVKRSAMRFVTNRLLNHVTRPLLDRSRSRDACRSATGCAASTSGSSRSTVTPPTTSRTFSASHGCASRSAGLGITRPRTSCPTTTRSPA